MRTPTIYEIKRRTADDSQYFFSRETLKHFGQTMKSFQVSKRSDGRFDIRANIYVNGKPMGITHRIFNPATNKLERE